MLIRTRSLLSDMIRLGARAVRRFAGARSGNVAVTFALAIIPIVGFVGAAVDYSRANALRSAMQAALDSTALMLSKDAAELSADELKAKATGYFNAQFKSTQLADISLTPVYTTAGGSELTLTGSGTMKTNFMGLVGIDKMMIGGSSYVKWGNTRLRVALVLDNTGSMASDGKMTALKTATKNLLKQLKSAAAQDGDVYVSIVPFSKDVNVGSGNYKANWIRWSGTSDGWDETNGTCKNYKNWYYWGSPSTKSQCQDYSGKWTADGHSSWNGCIMDRGTASAPGITAGYDQKVDAPTPSTPETLFPAEQYGSCPTEMKGLSYDWTAMNTLVDGMYPNGSTNQPIGLVWGWQSLVGGGPLSAPAKDTNYEYSEVIILLSDGLNTQDRWYGNGSSTSTAVDNRMYASGGSGTCKNIKDAGITIYTIQVNTGGDPTSTLLQNCASDTGKFFMLTSADQIVSTFEQIGTHLSNLRIAK